MDSIIFQEYSLAILNNKVKEFLKLKPVIISISSHYTDNTHCLIIIYK